VLGGGLAVEKGAGADVTLKLHVGRSDIWDRRKGTDKKLSQGNDFQMDRPRLILGHFALTLTGAALAKGRMRLKLHDAVLTASFEMDGGATIGVTVERCRLTV